MTHPDTHFAAALQDIARSHLEALLSAYRAVTGFEESTIGKLVQGDPKWASGFRGRNFGVATYDQHVRRFSAVWPADAEWPADVPRQAPEALPPDALEKLTARLLGSRAPVHHQKEGQHG